MCWIGTSGCLGPAAALADQYRWRAGLGNASLSVGLKRLIYSLKYRAKRLGQSGVKQKGEEGRAAARWGQRGYERGSSSPWPSVLPPSSAHSPAFLRVTYLSGAARSHYRSVRKADGRVASPSALVTDCRSALAAKEVRGGM